MTPIFDHPQMLDIARVVRNPDNPRKRFKQSALEDLAASIKRHGVLQPILCRPTLIGDVEHWQIVAGERRWTASRMAEQPQVPAIVREMTDAEAMEVTVIENAQREDLHPLEEAEGFEALLRIYGHGEANKASADDLAAKIGKSRTHIYNRLKLLQLIPDLREAFFNDEFNATVAQQLARLPAKLQPKAYAALRKITTNGDQVNVRESSKLLRQQFHTRMDKAVFPIKDATLVPSAGACTTCPRMSGNEPDLFGDEPDNVCTDPDCFQSKLLAFNERIKAQAREAGLAVIEGADANALLRFGKASDDLGGDYVYMDRGLPALTGNDKSLSRLLGTHLKASALFEHPADLTLREIVQLSKAIDALRKQKLLMNDPAKDKAKPPKGRPPETTVATKPDTSRMDPSPALQATDDTPDEDEDSEAEAQDQRQAEQAWRIEAFKAVHKSMHDADSVPVLGLQMAAIDLAIAYLQHAEAWALICDLWGFVSSNPFVSFEDHIATTIKALDHTQVLMLLAQLTVVPDVFPADASDLDKGTLNLVELCEDEDIAVDWAILRRKALHPELTEPDLPHQSPARAGEALTRASKEGGDTSPPENQGQAPQGAQTKEGSQLAHWVGQKVRIKGAKTIGEVTELLSDGALEVATPAGEEGCRNLRTLLRTEVDVLPGQTPPRITDAANDNSAWKFPGEAETRHKNAAAAAPAKHWPGQRVKVIKAKREGKVVAVNDDGTLDVSVISWRTNKANTRTLSSDEVAVLPTQSAA